MFFFYKQMPCFSIVIPIYPPHFQYINRVLDNIDRFEGAKIVEVIFAMSEILSYNEPYTSKYEVIFECSSAKCNSAVNRNRGWAKAKGDWVVFCDADDFFHPLKLQITEKVINEYPDAQCVLHNYLYGCSNFTPFDAENYEITTNDTIKQGTFPNGWIDSSKLCFFGGDTNVCFGKNAAQGIVTVRRDMNIRYTEHERFVGREDGYFCRSVCWFIGGLIYIDLPLMIYKPTCQDGKCLRNV